MSHQSTTPAVVTDYCQRMNISTQHPVYVGEVFSREKGWKRHPINKRVSKSELLRLRRGGASMVSLHIDGHHIDFSIKELVNT